MTPQRRFAPVWLAVALTACPAPDADGDGVPDSADCAPEDAAISPGAPDPWGDGTDANCDGSDGTDADGDGWPVDADPAVQLPDCDDSDPDTWPGRPWEEPRDGLDQDCDGTDGSSIEMARMSWFWSQELELWTGGTLAGGGDLDGDGIPELLVGAPEWLWSRGRVLAFSGAQLAEPGEFGADSAAFVLDGPDSAALNFGHGVSFVGDADGDGRDEILAAMISASQPAGAFLAWSSELEAGAATPVDQVGIHFSGGEPLAIMGRAVAGSPDGLVLLGNEQSLEGTFSGGYLFRPEPGWPSAVGVEYAAARLELGETPFDGNYGHAVGLAELDGDGIQDALLISWGSAAGLVLGTTWDGAGEAVQAPDYLLQHPAPGEPTGLSVAVLGDLDGDGGDEFALRTIPHEAKDGPGFVHLVFSRLLDAAEPSLDDVALRIPGEQVGDKLGLCLGAGGDIDGDGIPDLLVGSLWSLYVYSGADLATALQAGETASPRAVFGIEDGANLESACTVIGDLNGDGAAEFAVIANHVKGGGVQIIPGHAGP